MTNNSRTKRKSESNRIPILESQPDVGAQLRRESDERKVEWVPVASLKTHPKNPRTHSRAQIRQIVESVRKFGWMVPILVDKNCRVIAGHARLDAARILGVERVPIIRIAHLTEAETRAYIIADNKLAENAGWNQQLLAAELQFLSNLDIDFDLTVTGFETAEIDLLIQGSDSIGAGGVEDEIPPIDPSTPTVTQLGDLWIAQRHHLLCADATQQISFRRLLGRKKAQMIFTDPPWNLKINGNVSGLGSIKHREFPMASGEMSESEFDAFLKVSFTNLAYFSTDGSIHFICIDWRHLFDALGAARSVYSELKNVCVWVKDNGGMGSLFRSRHEMILVLKNGNAPHINNVELGRFGRNRTNVWNYPGANSLRDGRRDELAMHPTTKPVAMVADAILDCSKRGGIVLDSFSGAGSTLIAAEKTGRRGYLMELDPAYVDVAIRRFEKLTGEQAIHADIRRKFADVQRERVGEQNPAREGQVE